jgi:hypothetical protein
VSDDALPSERVIIRPLKKILIGMRVENELCTAARELRPEVRSIKAS